MIGELFCSLGKAFGGCELEIELPNDYQVFNIGWETVFKELSDLGITSMIELKNIPDRNFYYTDMTGWEAIFPNLIYPADNYIKERCDCDDYSKKASADSSFKFGLNCIQAWGNTPYEFHAFNMVLVANANWKIIEPNAGFECAGELLDINNLYGWSPAKWKP